MQFEQDLAKIFIQPFSKFTKLSIVCRLVCEQLRASSASILAYSGKKDRLFCLGRNLNIEIDGFKIEGNENLEKVLKNISLCEYLYTKGIEEVRNYEEFYDEYCEYVVCSKKITMEDFRWLCDNVTNWKSEFENYCDILKKEEYECDEKSLTGKYFKQLLAFGKRFRFQMFVEDIKYSELSEDLYEKLLKENLNITFRREFYVGLPLFANGRYFGVLSLIFPNDMGFIKRFQKEYQLDAEHNSLFQRISGIISLQLENDYFLDSYKKTYLLSQIFIKRPIDVEAYLTRQCEVLSEIIECKGAIIRIWDKDKKNAEVEAFSDTMQQFSDFIEKSNKKLSNELLKYFEEDKKIFAVHFYCLENPTEVAKYFKDEDTENYKYIYEKWTFPELEDSQVLNMLTKLNIANVAILPVPYIEKSFIIFFNTKNRVFLSKDIEMVHPAVKKIGSELSIIYNSRRIEKRQEIINEMHEEVNKIIKRENLKAEEYVKTFLQILSNAIDSFNIFTHHYIWQYVSESLPNEFKKDEKFIFRNITRKSYLTNPFSKHYVKKSSKNSLMRLKLNRSQFKNEVINSHRKNNLDQIFDFELKKEFSSFDLPFLAERESVTEQKPIGIITFIYDKAQKNTIESEDFTRFMQFFAKQISIAWNKLLEKIISEVQEKIDRKTGLIIDYNNKKLHTKTDELNIISEILSEEFGCELCCFFLFNEIENTLDLVGSNVPIKGGISYSLENDKNTLTVNSYMKGRNFCVYGREKVERITNSKQLETLENQTRGYLKKKIWEIHKLIFQDICIEHWLSVVINLGPDKLGLIKLFRVKGLNDRTNLKERYKIVTPPFSEFETSILTQIQEHIYNIIKTHQLNEKAIQGRIQDMRNVVHQVVAPLNALILHCKNLMEERIPAYKVPEKLHYIYIMSRHSARYARNFQKLLDWETGNLELDLIELESLNSYLINLAIDFQPLAKKKEITIHVIPTIESNVKLDVDLFTNVIQNLLDNAVKYSFDAQQRIKYGFKDKPTNLTDIENILIDIVNRPEEVEITVSNCGWEIQEKERGRIFSREYRGERAKDISPNGSGIGLFLAKEIVELHKGTLKLIPQDNINITVFKITLPKGSK